MKRVGLKDGIFVVIDISCIMSDIKITIVTESMDGEIYMEYRQKH